MRVSYTGELTGAGVFLQNHAVHMSGETLLFRQTLLGLYPLGEMKAIECVLLFKIQNRGW